MKKHHKTKVREFGHYRNEINDPQARFGLVYRVLSEGQVHWLRDTRPGLIFPIETCVASLRIKNKASVMVDPARVFLFSGKDEIEVVAQSPMLLFAVFYFSDEVMDDAAKLYDLDTSTFKRTIVETAEHSRTNWLNELGHRYLYERLTLGRHNNLITQFLEQEIVKEIYYYQVARDTVSDQRRRFIVLDPNVQKLVNHIEKHVFETVRIKDLLKIWRTSESTLQRAFKKELGMTVSKFMVSRKLDEAEVLLRTKRYRVSEVAYMTGYSTPAAFSTAFKQKFGATPGEVKDES